MNNKKLSLNLIQAIKIILIWIFICDLSAVMTLYIAESFVGKSLHGPVKTIVTSILSFVVLIKYVKLKYDYTYKNIIKKWKINSIQMIGVLVSVIGIVILLSEIDNFVDLFFPLKGMWKEIFSQMLDEKNGIMVIFISVGFVAPIIEEIIFRGIILEGLLKNYSEKKAIIISALLFGIVHMNIWQFIVASLFGLILGYWYSKTKSIFICIFAHIINNVIPIISVYLLDIEIKGFNDSLQENVFQPLWFDFLGIIFTIMGLILFKKSLTMKTKEEDDKY